VTATIDANGNRTEYTYDALNRRIQVKDAQGAITKTTYDQVGDVLSVTDALNRTTSFVYDALNRQISQTDALGYTSSVAYNAIGNIISTTDALSRTTSFGYDNLNRRISSTDALGQTQSVTYDIVGNVLSTTDELGRTSSFGYDSVDRRTSSTDPLGHISSTSYDTEGNVISTTDSIGNKTFYLYDAENRRVQVIDAKGGITKTGYDAVGNIDKITDSVNNITSYTFDAVDRLITDTNQLGFSRSYDYDAVGNQVEMIDRNGRKTSYGYDTLNRQTTEKWMDVTNTDIKTFSSVYDAVGHLLTSTNPDSKYTYAYDAIDRVISIDNTGTIGVPAVKFSYAYDAVGNLLTVNDSISGNNAGITAYTYDLLNRLTRLTQSGTGVQSKQVDMSYNALNQMTSLKRFSGNSAVAETSYIYDNNQRLIKLSHQKGANTIASYDYTFDDADKLSKTASSTDGTSNYSYDATNQLTGATHGNQADEAYQYDANGNRINSGYQTGANNQLLNDGTFTYEYDGEGNRSRRVETATGKVTEYVWDYRNRLSSVLFKDSGGAVTKAIDYLYDGDNQRIGKRIDGAVTERYVLDRNQIALVFDGQGNQTHRYLYGTQIDQVLADEASAATVWALGDNQGTIRDLIDNGGSLVEHLTYDSFGKIISTPITDFRYGYTGREQDSETGLDYYRARYYDSANGRFISEDPIGFDGEDSNLTRYVGNNAINYEDPLGLRISEKQIIDSGSGFGGGGSGGPLPGVRYNPGGSITTPYRPPYTAPSNLRLRYQPNYIGPPNPAFIGPRNLQAPSNNPNTFSDDQLDVFENKRAKVTQYKDLLRADNGSVENPNCDERKKCKTYELDKHLGGPPSSKGSRYASYATGSSGDFLIFIPEGLFAFYDGLVTTNGKLSESYGVNTTRHVGEAKAWNYGNYGPNLKTITLNKLKYEANVDRIIAKRCKYTYSVVTSSPALTRAFKKIEPGISIYKVAFNGDK
jgi:RHS repeat-associated protein